ncbi:hypothetical protein AGMMS50230_05500 [Spirochaetia bacterium]|nr:hypothetical protein AGMMS50230_05500 [Spirochaetia bacterium]
MNENQRPFIILAVFLAIAAGIVLFCVTRLEIADDVRWKDPSREAQANSYLALDRWLGTAGYAVRVLSMGNISTILKGPEKTVFLEDSRFTWTNQNGAAEAILFPWIKEGGRLIISLDKYADPRLEVFMEALGVKETGFSYDEDDETGEAETAEAAPPAGTTETAETAAETPGTDETAGNDEPKTLYPWGFFDWMRSFKLVEKKPPVDRIRIIKDTEGVIKLVQLEMEKGWVVFTGQAHFLNNSFLKDPKGAALARELFFDPATADVPAAEQPGILFIRSLTGEKHLLGNLAERGDPRTMGIALALLLIAGLWMVIPSFGRYHPAPEKPGKPLRERFLAEGRFLKKYRALDKYIEVYKKELEHRRRSGGFEMPAVEPAKPQAGAQTAGKKSTRRDAKSALSFTEFLKAQETLIDQLNQINQTDHFDKSSQPRLTTQEQS